jgi:hypothetical protein
MTNQPTALKLSNKMIGTDDQTYCLTVTELRTLADAAEALEATDPQGDITTSLNIEGLDFHVTYGWDSTGCFGVLEAWMD